MATSSADSLSEAIEATITQSQLRERASERQLSGQHIELLESFEEVPELRVQVTDVPISGQPFTRQLQLYKSDGDVRTGLNARLPKHDDGTARVFEFFPNKNTWSVPHQAYSYFERQYPEVFNSDDWSGFWSKSDNSSIWNVSRQWAGNVEGVSISTMTTLLKERRTNRLTTESSFLRCYNCGENKLLGTSWLPACWYP